MEHLPLLPDADGVHTSTDEHESDAYLDLSASPTLQYKKKAFNYMQLCCLLFIRILSDFMFKNPLIFWDIYAAGFGITNLEFVYILICSELGCICAAFFGQATKHHFNSYLDIMCTYLIISGTATLLLIIAIYYPSSLFTIIWCSICRFIIGFSFSFISTASIQFVSHTVDAQDIPTVIAILHYSWPIGTILNLAALYVPWLDINLIAGLALVGSGIMFKLVFSMCNLFDSIKDTESRQMRITNPTFYQMMQDGGMQPEDESESEGLLVIFSDVNALLILASSFFMSIRARTIYVVTSSLWMDDVFENPIDSRYATLMFVVGEVLALLAVAVLTHRYTLWKSTVFSLLFQFFFGGFLLWVFSVIFGDNMVGATYQMSLAIALMMICLLTGGHESFLVIQQSNAIFYAPRPSLSFLLLLAERMSQEIAAIIAILITVTLWQVLYNDAILIFSVIWMVTTVLQSSVLLIYKTKHGF